VHIFFQDMINIIKVSYLPNTLCWCYNRGDARCLLAVSDLESGCIYFYDGRDVSQQISSIDDNKNESSVTSKGPASSNGRKDDPPLFIATKIHSSSVHIMQYNPNAGTVVSIDQTGMIEYWIPDLDAGFPTPTMPKVSWQFKSQTDLYEFKKVY
jgi:peptidylprolyl isomerase domain and WD repeat-containing protein 1